eukprot:TRINITY_DN26478_c1_g1_i1.p1 TRINITY_DN26478_c1_g1~~TRINITY_DN26478_c1_g1_i1.p1  ORF type:complete len:135 (-),score=5.13 TRINITY_DN26478_c1_g1_i1:1855-2259(-)
MRNSVWLTQKASFPKILTEICSFSTRKSERLIFVFSSGMTTVSRLSKKKPNICNKPPSLLALYPNLLKDLTVASPALVFPNQPDTILPFFASHLSLHFPLSPPQANPAVVCTPPTASLVTGQSTRPKRGHQNAT